MTKPTDTGRRRFLKTGAMAVAALPLSTLIHQRSVKAMPQAEDGHALDYVNDAADAADHPEYEEGQYCHNCAFWAGAEDNGWGQCHHPEFADVLVNEDGWCSVWAG
ncbi:high-potential iron-sulfur protein [Aquisalimonas sp.]|uniref:high-potential iron-sulfur protein n=1 Tax=Aquisalimonas sp. TaxID=1872621 RepID=UPI0025BE4251|nr:high-potential iron-sulfur protein [Aquisalimonas sp.]